MLTVHEKIRLLRSLLPAYLNGCRTIKAYLFIDLDIAMLMNVDRMVRQQQQMMLAIRNIQVSRAPTPLLYILHLARICMKSDGLSFGANFLRLLRLSGHSRSN